MNIVIYISEVKRRNGKRIAEGWNRKRIADGRIANLRQKDSTRTNLFKGKICSMIIRILCSGKIFLK